MPKYSKKRSVGKRGLKRSYKKRSTKRGAFKTPFYKVKGRGTYFVGDKKKKKPFKSYVSRGVGWLKGLGYGGVRGVSSAPLRTHGGGVSSVNAVPDKSMLDTAYDTAMSVWEFLSNPVTPLIGGALLAKHFAKPVGGQLDYSQYGGGLNVNQDVVPRDDAMAQDFARFLQLRR